MKAAFLPHRGVRDLRDENFFAVLLLQFAAFTLLARDPWFGSDHFMTPIGVLAPFLALIVVATCAWEERFLGEVRGANLFLHFTLLVPATLYVMRLAGRPAEPERVRSVWSWFSDRVGDLLRLGGLDDAAPGLLTEIFTNPVLVGWIGIVLIGFSLRSRRLKLGVLFLTLVIGFTAALGAPEGRDRNLLLATAMLAGAVTLQVCDDKLPAAYRAIFRALEPVESLKDYRTEAALAVRCVRRAALEEKEVNAIVSETFPHDTAEAARRLLDDLIRRRGLLTLTLSERGLFLTPSAKLLRAGESPLAAAAKIPRMAFLALLALIWLLAPIDLIPDSIPVFGLLDDAAVGILSSFFLYRSLGRSDSSSKCSTNPAVSRSSF